MGKDIAAQIGELDEKLQTLGSKLDKKIKENSRAIDEQAKAFDKKLAGKADQADLDVSLGELDADGDGEITAGEVIAAMVKNSAAVKESLQLAEANIEKNTALVRSVEENSRKNTDLV